MTKRGKRATWVDLQVAGVRWLAFLATAAGFGLVWLMTPQWIAFSLSSTPILILLGVAVLYNLLVTLLAWAGWLGELLPAGAVLADLLLVTAAYFYLVPNPDLTSFTVDPLFLMALLPVVTVAIRFHWLVGVVLGLLLGLVRAALLLWGIPDPLALSNLLLASFGVWFLVGAAFLSGYLGERLLRRGTQHKVAAARREMQKLRAVVDRAEALQEITGTLSATLSFERVLESALDVAEKAMAEWGAQGKLVGMVFLFEGDRGMRLAASRHLSRYELDRGIPGESGLVARCLEEADVVVSDAPYNDPELAAFTGMENCKVATAVPLRAGFQNYGVMIFATPAFELFNQEQIELFSDVAGRATIALHNALLYQDLQAEKDRIVAVEEEARHKLSRDLHDGPTQSVSAIAMRLNFVRKMLLQDPPRLKAELEIVEKLARQTVKEIRHMLFTLRPLVLETQGLIPALQSLADKIKETDGLNIQIREMDDATSRLDTNQAGVLFYIVEEALGNARKHSQASLIEVRFWIENDLFVAQVADDGVGFDTQEVLGNYESRGSLGMINMRERAELISGSLDLKSAPGQGTTITLVTPLRE